MDSRYIDYLLTDAESDQFERDGYFAVENALSKDMVDDLVVIVDRIDREERLRMNGDPADRTTIRDFIGRNDLFLELLDWHKTLPKVWGILGWHMQVEHSLDRCDPIRKQLLGVSYSGGLGYTSPSEEDIPLKAWLEPRRRDGHSLMDGQGCRWSPVRQNIQAVER